MVRLLQKVIKTLRWLNSCIKSEYSQFGAAKCNAKNYFTSELLLRRFW